VLVVLILKEFEGFFPETTAVGVVMDGVGVAVRAVGAFVGSGILFGRDGGRSAKTHPQKTRVGTRAPRCSG